MFDFEIVENGKENNKMALLGVRPLDSASNAKSAIYALHSLIVPSNKKMPKLGIFYLVDL